MGWWMGAIRPFYQGPVDAVDEVHKGRVGGVITPLSGHWAVVRLCSIGRKSTAVHPLPSSTLL